MMKKKEKIRVKTKEYSELNYLYTELLKLRQKYYQNDCLTAVGQLSGFIRTLDEELKKLDDFFDRQ